MIIISSNSILLYDFNILKVLVFFSKTFSKKKLSLHDSDVICNVGPGG